MPQYGYAVASRGNMQSIIPRVPINPRYLSKKRGRRRRLGMLQAMVAGAVAVEAAAAVDPCPTRGTDSVERQDQSRQKRPCAFGRGFGEEGVDEAGV